MYLLLYKQFVNGVPFDLKEYAKILLYGPLKVFSRGYIPTPQPTIFTGLPLFLLFSAFHWPVEHLHTTAKNSI